MVEWSGVDSRGVEKGKAGEERRGGERRVRWTGGEKRGEYRVEWSRAG